VLGVSNEVLQNTAADDRTFASLSRHCTSFTGEVPIGVYTPLSLEVNADQMEGKKCER